MNPRLHLNLHAVVERQIASDEPRGVAWIASKLEALGLSRHEVRHEIARPVSNQMFSMMQEKRVFDEKQYMRELRGSLKRQKRRKREG